MPASAKVPPITVLWDRAHCWLSRTDFTGLPAQDTQELRMFPLGLGEAHSPKPNGTATEPTRPIVYQAVGLSRKP